MTTYPDLTALHADLSACRRCAEAGYHIEGPPVFSGTQQARLMLIGQAPGPTEAVAQRPFNGEAGRRLFRWLERAGWSETEFRARCYITSVTKCFPGKAASGGGDRVPSKPEQLLCRTWLDAEMEFIKPQLIVPVGMLAIRLFYPKEAKLEDIVGTHIQDEQGRIILPLPHPSGASRWHSDPRNVGRIEQAIFDLKMLKLDLNL